MCKIENNQIKLSEQEMIEHITDFINECDSDELARITGDIFGGKCFWSDNNIDKNYDLVYSFEPNENYAGEFGDLNLNQ